MTETKVESAERIIYNKPSEGSWDIPGVLDRGKKITCRLFEEMTPALNQDQLAEFYEIEKQKGNPHPESMPFMLATFRRAYELRGEDEGNLLQKFLHRGLRTFPNTLTRIVYNPSEEDCVIHNYGTADAYSLHGNIVGSDGWINRLGDPAVLEKIVGTYDTKKINEVSQYINGTDTYLWRLNSKPKQKDERVARFDAFGGRLILGCGRNPRYVYPAFRVLRVE